MLNYRGQGILNNAVRKRSSEQQCNSVWVFFYRRSESRELSKHHADKKACAQLLFIQVTARDSYRFNTAIPFNTKKKHKWATVGRATGRRRVGVLPITATFHHDQPQLSRTGDALLHTLTPADRSTNKTVKPTPYGTMLSPAQEAGSQNCNN